MTKKRARVERRAVERGLRKDVRGREKLGKATVGGAPDRPIVVSSSSVLDGRARSVPCWQCGGQLESKGDSVVGDGIRKVSLTCRLCHAPRELFFRIETTLAN